jgi:hypothetical protein
MDSAHPGRLRPWVRFRTPRGIVEARPDPTISMTGWADILWDWCVNRQDQQLREHMTAFRSVDLDWSMEPARRVKLSKHEMLDLGVTEPEVAALAWGQNRPRSLNPWPRWKRWAALMRCQVWPFGLLCTMAREGCVRELAVPGYECEPWILELSVTAASWLGLAAGMAVWNGLAAGGPPELQRKRWILSFATGSGPQDGMNDAGLDRLLTVLAAARPQHQPHWQVLLNSEADTDDLSLAWGQDLDRDQLHEVTLRLSSGLRTLLNCCPERLAEYLRERMPCPGQTESEVVNLFARCRDWKLRVLLLACLHELKNPGPSKELLGLAQRHPRGGEILQLLSLWQGSGAESVIQIEGLDSAQLARLSHWRHLIGRGEPFPKTLRSWLRREQGPRDPDGRLRQLLKIQQNFAKLYREEGARAWRALLQPFCVRLLAEFCGRPQVGAEHLELGPLVECPEVSGALLGRLFETQSDLNSAWLRRAPSRLRQDVWLRGLEVGLKFGGQLFQMVTADRWQTLHMGSDFNTCLTLKDGCYRQSVLLNALDANKQVLYLRDLEGNPVMRQLLAITRCGRLQLFPIYSHSKLAGLEGTWNQLVSEYARDCGLELAPPSAQVEQIHPMSGYYCDHIPLDRPYPDQVQQEMDFLAAPYQAREGGDWSVPSQLAALQRGSRLGFDLEPRVAAMLGELGAMGWLERQTRYLPGEFLENLDYRADCSHLDRYFGRGGRLSGKPIVPPAALVSLPFGPLARVLLGLGPSIQWLQALCLLLVAWWRRPDPGALWRLLRGQSWLAELLPVYFRVIPNLPTHLRLAGRETVTAPLSEWKIRCLEGFWLGLNGAHGALKRWASGQEGLERSWCLQVLGRLWLDGQLRIEARLLAFWCFEFGDQSWLARDLGLEWRNLEVGTVVVGLLRSPEETWRYLEQLPPTHRFGLTTQLIWMVSPELWQQLAEWRPSRESLARPEWLAAEQAAEGSFRLRQWLNSLSPESSAAAGPGTGRGT